MAAMVPEGQTMEPVARALGSRAFASPWGLRQEWGVGLWPSACVVEPRVCGGVWICEESAEEAWLARGAAARHGRIWDRLNVYECSDAVPLVFKHVTPRRAGRSEVGQTLLSRLVSKVSLRASHGVFPRDRWLCVLPRWT